MRAAALVLVSLALVAGGFVFLSRLPALRIAEVRVEGVAEPFTGEIAARARAELSGAYGFLVPKSNSFLYPREALAAAILDAFPRLASAKLERDGLTALTIRVAPRTAAALWCGGPSSHCYAIDHSGVIYEEVPPEENSALLVIRGGRGAAEPVGGSLLTPERFRELLSFALYLKDRGLAADALAITPEGDYRFGLSGGAELRLAGTQAFGIVRENFEAVLSSDDFKKKSLAGLEYIDLRFGNKIYYREK